MHRIVILYEQAPDSAQYAEHVELCSQAPNGVFRHGPITGSPMGEPKYAYYGEWEFADKAAFDAFVASDLFRETGKDAYKRGFPMPQVSFAEVG